MRLYRSQWVWVAVGVFLFAGVAPAPASIELVSLPDEGRTELTIYKPANLTYVRETRRMTLSKGTNRIQFDWSETRIDPTSVRISIPQRDDVRVKQLTYPAHEKQTLIWSIAAAEAGRARVEISYFTLGITWDALYRAELNKSETSMDLTGYVRLNNRSGERFENARIQLLTGKVHLLDKLAEVIRRWEHKHRGQSSGEDRPERVMMKARSAMAPGATAESGKMTTEGVSEYHLLSLEGRETLRSSGSKRLAFMSRDDVPVINHYRFWPQQSKGAQRIFKFTNDDTSGLGNNPLPAGPFQVYRNSSKQSVTLLATRQLDYLPVGETSRIELGSDPRVQVTRRVMNRRSSLYEFTESGRVSGWQETRTTQTTVSNDRSIPIVVDVHHQFESPSWTVIDHSHEFEQISRDRIRFRLNLKPGQTVRLRERIRFSKGTLRN